MAGRNLYPGGIPIPVGSAYQFANGNGVTFGVLGNTVTASVAAPVAGTGLVGTGFSGTNISGTLDSNGLQLSVAAGGTGGGAQTTQTQAAGNIAGAGFTFAGTNVSGSGTHNSNGLSLALSGLATVAQTVQTQASGNIAGTGVSTVATAGANITGVLGTNGLSLAVPAFLTTAQSPGAYLTTAAQSNHSHNFATVGTAGSQIVVGTTNSAGATIGVPSFITTYVNDLTSGRAGTGFTSTTVAGVAIAATLNTAGLSMAVPNFLTTAAAQTVQTQAAGVIAGVGTTFSGTNVSGSMTLNSNGLNLALSAAAPGGGGGGIAAAAGTQTATSGTINFANSNGITFGMSNSSQITASYTVPSTAGLLSAVNLSAGTTSGNLSNMVFSNSGGMSFGLNGSTVTGQQVIQLSGAGGAAARTNFSFVNSNGLSWGVNGQSITASVETSYAASNHSHGNPTLALTNLSGTTASNSNGVTISLSVAAGGGGGADGGVFLSAAGSSQSGGNIVFSNSHNMQFGMNGSTITASALTIDPGVTHRAWAPIPFGNNTSYSSLGQNSLYLQHFIAPGFGQLIEIAVSARGSFVSSSNSQVYAHTLRYGMYEDDGSQLTLIDSSSIVMSASYNSNTAAGITVSQGAGSYTTTSAGTGILSMLSGPHELRLPFVFNPVPNGSYAFGFHVSSATTVGTGPARFAPLVMTNMNTLSIALVSPSTVIAAAASVIGAGEMGVGTVTTGALPDTVQNSAISIAVSRQLLPFRFVR